MVQIIAIKYFLQFQVLNYKQIYTNQQMLYLITKKIKVIRHSLEHSYFFLPVDGVNVVADAAVGR